MRFNSPEHLSAWRDHGRYPAIHDALANVAVANMRGKRLLDLGCSYGLLGTRIMKEAGAELGVGVDGDAGVLAAARAAGIPLHLDQLNVNRGTLPTLTGIVVNWKVDVLIARRVLPELFGEDKPLGLEFAASMAGVDVEEMFLEGRVSSARSVNALHNIEQEVELLSASYREVRRFGAVSYLVRR